MSFILVTGVSSGIGLAILEKFISEGHIVFGSVIRQEDAISLKDRLGDNYIPLLFDVTDVEEVKKSYEFVKKTVGKKGLSLLVNNAGIAVYGPMQHVDIDSIRYQFEVNVFAVVSVTQIFLPLLGASKNSKYPKGKIITISSVAGRLTNLFFGPYSGSKHAIEAIFDALRRELKIYGIPVILIMPGPIKSKIWKKAKKEGSRFAETDYAKVFEDMDEEIEKIEKIALPVEKLGKLAYKVYKSKRPKIRYLITPNKFFIWLAIYILPERLIDWLQYKNMKKKLLK